MTPEGVLHVRARRLMRTEAFARLSDAAAVAIVRHDIVFLGDAMAATGATADTVMFMARVQGVSAWLAALSEAQPGALSATLHATLQDERLRIAARHHGLLADLRALGAAAADRGLALVPLKGAVLAIRDPAAARMRPTADIDLLVEAAELDHWARLLVDLGYRRGRRSIKHDTFRKPSHAAITGYQEDPQHPRPVEVHSRLRESLLGRTIDVTERYRSDLRLEAFEGLAVRLPGPVGLALHQWLHLGLCATRRGARLLQFLDLTSVQADLAVGPALAGTLDEIAWGIWTLGDRIVPGRLPRAWEGALLGAAPPPRRQRAWRARRGLLGGTDGDVRDVAAQLRLCRSPGESVRHLASLVPERAHLESFYGESGRGRAAGLVRYVVDRLAWGRDRDDPNSAIRRS